MIVTITGHRPDKLGGYETPNPIYNAIIESLDKALMELRPSLLYTGMALGVDQWAAQLCVLNDIPFTATLPFFDSDNKWPPHARQRFRELCQLAQNVHIVTPTNIYSPHLMQVRNQYMVRNSDLVLAVWNGSSGGTQNCVNYARKIGKQVSIVKVPASVWEEAEVEYQNILSQRQIRANQQQMFNAQMNSAIITAANNAIAPETLFGPAQPEPQSVIRGRVTEEVRRVDVLAPRRKIEL